MMNVLNGRKGKILVPDRYEKIIDPQLFLRSESSRPVEVHHKGTVNLSVCYFAPYNSITTKQCSFGELE